MVPMDKITQLIPVFGGQNAEEWIERLNLIKENYDVNDELMLLTMIDKFDGFPLEWFIPIPNT